MKFPGAPYGLKMACGENPKRVYGVKGQDAADAHGQYRARRARPGSRRSTTSASGTTITRMAATCPSATSRWTRSKGVLEGKILVQNHCYRADEMANMIDMAKEFGYHIAAFHHAVEAYKIADLLRDNDICAVMWADWYGFKMEAYDAINENIALVHNAGACAMVHSDDPNGIQRLNQEAAKALADGRRAGIQHLRRGRLGMAQRQSGQGARHRSTRPAACAPGKMADVVLWNGNPFSVYTRPEQVWIDGALMYDAQRSAAAPGQRLRARPARRRRREMIGALSAAALAAASRIAGRRARPSRSPAARSRSATAPQPIPNGTVVIRDGRVVAAGADVAVPAGRAGDRRAAANG